MGWMNKILTFIGIIFGLSLTLIGFFLYEEQSDIYRYAQYGIILTKDDHFQSLGARQLETTPEKLNELLGQKASLTFGHLDRDGNGLLSATEIEPLVHLLKQNVTHQLHNPSPSCIRDCLRMSVSVGTIDFSNSLFINSVGLKSNVSEKACPPRDGTCKDDVKDMKAFVAPLSVKNRLVDHRHFLAFLPRSKEFTVGRSYHIVDSVPEADVRYRDAPKVDLENYLELHERALTVILGHFMEARVNLYPSTDPRFSMAVVRAKNSDFVEVYFRLMVEFDGPDMFDDNDKQVQRIFVAPSALVGRMILRLSDFQVVDFHLHQESDIFVISMTEFDLTIVSKLSSFELKSVSSQVNASDISWTEAVSPKEATDLLRHKMHGLESVNFLSLSELAEKLRKREFDRRPVLLLVCINSLFDQSCRFGCTEMRMAMGNPKVVVKLRYEFVLALTTHFELKKLFKSNDLSPEMENLKTLTLPSNSSAFSLIVLKPDGSDVLSRTSFSELARQTAELLEPLRQRTDVERQAEEDLREGETDEHPGEEVERQFNNRLAQEKRIKELSSTSLLEFLDNALSQLAGS